MCTTMMRFLIIDDDVFVHTNLKKMINWEAEGFSLYDAAIYGAEAVRMIDQIGPDIVITDMNMPGIDGVGIIRYLLEKHTPIKVIALSAYDDFEYVKQSLKLGAVDYILKHTLTPEVLLNLLHGDREVVFAAEFHQNIDPGWNQGSCNDSKKDPRFRAETEFQEFSRGCRRDR